ncbi:MAG: PadR family transcriptional regulator [Planctomycetota bacterium]
MTGRTELEMVVLGIIWKQGPCTAHAVRMEFAASKTSHWRGSAGSIYPLVRRLEGRGLVNSKAGHRKRQARRLYSIASAGEALLRDWLGGPQADEVFSTHYNPVRTRLYFLGVLPPRKQKAFLMAAEESIRRRLPELERDRDEHEAEGWTHSALAVEESLFVMRAQLRWLSHARRVLAEHPRTRN